MPFDDTTSLITAAPAPVATSRKAKLHHLFRMWSALRGDRRSPLTSDVVKLVSDPELTGSVTVLDVMDDGQLRYVYVGTRVVNFMQRNVTGLVMNADLYGEEAFSELQDKLYFVAAFNMPMCLGARIYHGDDWKDIEWMSVPLSDEDGTVRRIANVCVVVNENHVWQLPGAPTKFEITRDYEDCATMAENCTTSHLPTRDARCALYECSGRSCAELGCPHVVRDEEVVETA